MKFIQTTKSEDLSTYCTGHIVDHPQTWRSGVLFASPHSGSIYPKSLLKRSHLSAHQLRRNEDIFVDTLFESVVDSGAPLLRALFPRIVVDVNRAPDELLPEWLAELGHNLINPQTPRSAAGLGVVPINLSETISIYSRPLKIPEIKARLDTLYHPYHATLQGLLSQSLERFGRALLIDCHSMPGFAPMGARRPDVILGDKFGTSCHPDTVKQFKALFTQAGYNVGVNYPYAGGYTTAHYGSPVNGVEAIQIELNRDIYVNPVTLAPKPGYRKLKDDLERISRTIIEQSRPQDVAAQ